MGSLKHPGRPVHNRLVQPLGVKIRPVNIEGVLNARIVDAIGIFLFDAGANGVKILRHLIGPAHHDVLRDMGIHREGDALHGDTGAGVKIGHIVFRVYPALDLLPAHHAETLFQSLGHSPFGFLHLPAVIGRAVIHEYQCNIPHSASFLSLSQAEFAQHNDACRQGHKARQSQPIRRLIV